MGLLKKTKSFWQERRAGPEAPPPLPPLNEEQVPPLLTTQQKPQHQSFQRPPEPRQYIKAEHIRELRERIRYRYSLDIEIWKQRDVKRSMRDNLKENMRKSDAALADIRKILQDWDRREYFATEEEYKKFQEIKQRLLIGNKVNWEKNPPWEPSIHQLVPRPPYEMNGRVPSVAHRYGSVSHGSPQVVREDPGDVPFAQPSQRQNQRAARPLQQRQYAANAPLQQHQYTANAPSQQHQHDTTSRPQPHQPRGQYDVSPLRQNHHVANTPRQIQHAGNPLPQLQHVRNERQSPFTANAPPPPQHPPPRLNYSGDFTQRSSHAVSSPQRSELAQRSPSQSSYATEFMKRNQHAASALPPSELGLNSPPPLQHVPLHSQYATDHTQQEHHAISSLQRSELDPSPPRQSQYIAYTPPDYQNQKTLSSLQHIPETGSQQDPPPPPSSVSSFGVSQSSLVGMPFPHQSQSSISSLEPEQKALPSRQRPSFRTVSSPPQIKLTAPTPPVERRVLSAPLHMERPPSSQPNFPGY